MLSLIFFNNHFFIASATDTKAENLTTAEGGNFAPFVGLKSIFAALKNNWIGSIMIFLN